MGNPTQREDCPVHAIAVPLTHIQWEDQMANILIIYDSDSDRRFTETAVPFVKEGIEQVGGHEIRVKHVD